MLCRVVASCCCGAPWPVELANELADTPPPSVRCTSVNVSSPEARAEPFCSILGYGEGEERRFVANKVALRLNSPVEASSAVNVVECPTQTASPRIHRALDIDGYLMLQRLASQLLRGCNSFPQLRLAAFSSAAHHPATQLLVLHPASQPPHSLQEALRLGESLCAGPPPVPPAAAEQSTHANNSRSSCLWVCVQG
jgi:hypothetical protein